MESKIVFSDFADLEILANELEDVKNLLSILGENMFNEHEPLSPYLQQFSSVNYAAYDHVKKIQAEIINIFNVLHKKDVSNIKGENADDRC